MTQILTDYIAKGIILTLSPSSTSTLALLAVDRELRRRELSPLQNGKVIRVPEEGSEHGQAVR